MAITAMQEAVCEQPSIVPIERRQEDRHQATYRPCCLIASDQVSMGLIRNYSLSGARIETDAAFKVEVGDPLTYFWEASKCIPARVVWTDGRAIGVEHTEHVEDGGTVYPMRSVRVPCQVEATCWVNGEIHTALVENISIGGMRLKGLPEVEPGTPMTVSFCGKEFTSVTVRWSNQLRTGLRFANRMTREALANLLTADEFGLSRIDFNAENAQ